MDEPIEQLAPPSDPSTSKQETPANPNKKKNDEFRTRITSCKEYRRKLVTGWTANIDYRRGKPFASQTDQDRIVVNLDWSMTKTKQASLFSQVPQVRVSHPPQTTDLSPWVHTFEQRLNDTLIASGIESAMDECLPDVINAAGIAAILVSHEEITEMVDVPAIDLTIYGEQAPQIMQSGMLPDGQPLPMTQAPRTVDHRYVVNRLSPSDILWPLNFTGSDFDNAGWVGRSGRMTWARAVKQFNLDESEKDKVLGEDKTTQDRLTHDIDKDKTQADEQVCFDEVFYKEIEYDVASRSYCTIHHLVFIDGKTEPVIDEPWKGQKYDQASNQISGAYRFPIRFLTLAYLTDETIPPSDSAIGRPQVDELNALRTQNLLQRKHSLPVRWFDVNRVDVSIQQLLMKGTYQAMIPVQGAGDKIIGEVPMAHLPPENLAFNKIVKADLAEAWSIGPDQLGSGADVETKGESNVIESHYQTRIGRERAKVGKFFCSIAEVLGGLLCLFEDPSIFGQGFDPVISKTLCYSILADSTVLLDSNQKLERLINFVNFTGKTGFLNIEPVLKEIATLTGLDPNVVIRAPQPKPPTEPSISLRFTGAEDLMNPLCLAVMSQSGHAPTPEAIEAAKKLIQMIVAVAPPPPPPITEKGADGSTKVVPQPEVDKEGPKLEGLQVTLEPSVPVQAPTNQPPPPEIGKANPDWSAIERVNKRTEDGGAGNAE